MMPPTESLKARWEELSSGIAPAAVREKWWSTIEARYGEPTRFYHSLDHISKMFEHFEKHKERLTSQEAVALAIFFHDLVYNPRASDNEEESTTLFKQFATDCSIPEDSPLHTEVIKLILLTKTHMTEEHKQNGIYGSDDHHFFLDFDMAALGSSPEEYAEYAGKIRQEYSFFADVTYNELRAKVLKSFLQIPNIFATEEFRSQFEAQARSNIEKEITQLSRS